MQKKDLEKEYFDEFTAHDPWNAFTNATYKRIVFQFKKIVRPKRDDLIIDMGCGTGEVADALYQASFRNIIGFDISKNCIELAKKQFPQIEFKVADIENTKLKDKSVDVLFYCGILHHFTDMSGLIKEAKRILKPKGKIFVFEPNATHPVLWLFRDEKSPIKSTKLKTPNERFLRKKEIKRAFEKEQFQVMHLGCMSRVSYSLEHFRKLFPFPFHYSVFGYNIFDWLLHYTPLRKTHGSFIIGYMQKP